jgi:type I restriction enzyme M protein
MGSSAQGPSFVGVELVQDTHRLLLMNAILHDLNGAFLLDDSLSASGASRIPLADIILTNPPFGTKRGSGLPGRRDLPFPTTSKQLAFLQHVYLGLKIGGRAAVVVPDSALFEGNVGQQVRQDLMNKCKLHTILRLPDNIFYANVTTNVLFFHRDDDGTQDVWIYDMRANMPAFGKRTPLLRSHFADFEAAYGPSTDGSSGRIDGGEEGRFRCFSRSAIEQRQFNLAISWLRDERHGAEGKPSDPDDIAAQLRSLLESALDELDQFADQVSVDIRREPIA